MMRAICMASGLLSVAVALLPTPSVDAATDEREFSYPPSASLEQVKQWVDRAPREHPRLLVNGAGLAALRESLDADPLRRALADAVIANANALQRVAPVERRLQGRRLLGKSRLCLERVFTLAMAYHLTGDAKLVARCEKELLAAAAFSDWNPSHFLDVAEMTLALALGYDWLYHELPAATRKTVRTAILEKGVKLPFETRHKGWVRARNNWGQVCHGGLTAGALAVLEDEPAWAARTVHNAIHNVTRSMAAYAPKGSYPEGPGYWSYGTTYNVVLIALLESVLGTDFGLTKAPGFNATGEYPSLMTGPSGLFFNYADGGSGRSPQPALFWFAARFGRPDWLLGERDRLEALAAKIRRRPSGGGRLLPATLLWMEDRSAISDVRMPLHWQSESRTPVTVHRSSWTDPAAVFVGVKAGSPSAPHGQMDIGAFVLDADGVRWALDLGAEGYHGIESRGMNLWSSSQGSDRWKIFRQMNHGHNTLVIDDELQRASAKGTIVAFSADPAFPHTIVDMSPVYQGQAGSVRRGVALLSTREVLIRDELTGLKPGSRVRWGMVTPGKPGAAGGDSIELRQRDARLELAVRSSARPTWEIVDTATPRNAWDSPNRGTCMAAFHAVAPASGELAYTVVIAPGSATASASSRFEAKPLASWGK